MLVGRLQELERLKQEEQQALVAAALEHEAANRDLDNEKKRVSFLLFPVFLVKVGTPCLAYRTSGGRC